MPFKQKQSHSDERSRQFDNEEIGNVYLNVKTETASRSKLTDDDIKAGKQGHTWLTFETKQVTPEMSSGSAALIADRGETQVGFYAKEAKQDHAMRDVEGAVADPDYAKDPTGRKKFRMTRKQFKKIYQYIFSHRNHRYHAKNYNSTTFATHALKNAGLQVASENNAGKLYETFYEETKKSLKKRHQLPSDVRLLRLRLGESHRKGGAGKEGAQAPIQGVETFKQTLFDPVDTLVTLHKPGAMPMSQADRVKIIRGLLDPASNRTEATSLTIAGKAVEYGQISQNQYQALQRLFESYIALKTAEDLGDHALDYILNLRNAYQDADKEFREDLASDHFRGPGVKNALLKLWAGLLNSNSPQDALDAGTLILHELGNAHPELYLAFKKGFIKCLHQCTRYERRYLKIFQIFVDKNGAGWNVPQEDVYDYVKRYFNQRIQDKSMTPQDLHDAQSLNRVFHMDALTQGMAKIEQSVKESGDKQFYAKMYSRHDGFIDSVKNNYGKENYRGFEVVENEDLNEELNVDENAEVADVYLNVFTESSNRSHLSCKDLIEANVGHTWLTVTQRGNYLPRDLVEYLQRSPYGTTTVNLMNAKGSTALGFWPLKNRMRTAQAELDKLEAELPNLEGDALKIRKNEIIQKRCDMLITQAEMETRQGKGFTGGSGNSMRNDARGFHAVRSTPGTVEEPDDAHTPTGRRKFSLTRAQFKKLFQYVNGHRTHDYHLMKYNCTTFAAEALHKAGHNVGGTTLGVSLPNAMYKELYMQSKYDRSHHLESSVQLLNLGENETHSKNSAQRNIPSVERFDMIENYGNELEVGIRAFQLATKEEDKDSLARKFKKDVLQLRTKLNPAEILRYLDKAREVQMFKGRDEDKTYLGLEVLAMDDSFRTVEKQGDIGVEDNGEKLLQYLTHLTNAFGINYNVKSRKEAITRILDKIFENGVTLPLAFYAKTFDQMGDVLRGFDEFFFEQYLANEELNVTTAKIAMLACGLGLTGCKDVLKDYVIPVYQDNTRTFEVIKATLQNDPVFDDEGMRTALWNMMFWVMRSMPAEAHDMAFIETMHQEGKIYEENYHQLTQTHSFVAENGPQEFA